MTDYEYMTVTLENISHMGADQCTKFNAAVHALHGYNVQGWHCFECLAGKREYRVYIADSGFMFRVVTRDSMGRLKEVRTS